MKLAAEIVEVRASDGEKDRNLFLRDKAKGRMILGR